MKRLLIIAVILLNSDISYAESKLAYININYILNNSIVGKSINEHLNLIKEKKIKEFKIIEKELSKKEESILKKKNIIEKEELNKEVEILKKDIAKYKNIKKKFNVEIDEKKIKYTKEVLKTLNSIISKYVEENSIQIVFSKKDIIIAKKNLDITDPIITLLNNQLIKIEF